MKRKRLQQIEPVPQTMHNAEISVEAQIVSVDDRNILELDLYKKDGTLIARHFLDKEKEEYATLFTTRAGFENKTYKAGDWAQMKYLVILANGDVANYYWKHKEASHTSETLTTVEKYIASSSRYMKKTLSDYIDNTESNISHRKREAAFIRKGDRIDSLMATVTPITQTEEFQTWIHSVFKNKYIFAESHKLKKGYRCRCTACGGAFLSKEKPKHNAVMNCKKCGTEAMIKTRVQQVNEKKNVLVIQQCNDECVIRHFRFKALSHVFMRKAQVIISHSERVRIFKAKNKVEKIYYGQRRNDFFSFEESETKQLWWDKKAGMVIDNNFLLYPDNLKDVKMDKALISTLTCAAEANKEMNYNKIIRYWKTNSYIEYLIKSKFYRLASEISNNFWLASDLLYVVANDIPALLKLEPQRANRLRDMDGGIHALEFLQIEERDGIKISQENLQFVDQYKVTERDLEHDRTSLGINKELNYFRRQIDKNKLSLRSFKQYYSDYLDMAAERGMELTDDIVRVNPKMMEYHNRYLEEKNRKRDAERISKLRKKFPNIKKDYKENCKKMAWENDEYVVLVPRDVEDIVDEGRKQHHCVAASDTYMKRMNEHKSFILFLRKKKNPEEPYYTLEVELTKQNIVIRQRYAEYNRTPDVKEVDKVLSAWKKDIKKRRIKLSNE